MLVVHFARKLAQPEVVSFGNIQTESEQKQPREMQMLVTSTHVALILCYTLLTILTDNVQRFDGYAEANAAYWRVYCAWLFFGGLQDIFLANMIFFILDEEVTVFHDEKSRISYSVIDVIDTEASHQSD
jgi:hypothetical protein